MDVFTLIHYNGSRIKVFETFEDLSKLIPSNDAMMISYGGEYKRSSKPVKKGSRVETIEAARKEYKQKVIFYSQNPSKIKALKSKLFKLKSDGKLFNTETFTKKLEDVLKELKR